jgi:hypothetical protein
MIGHRIAGTVGLARRNHPIADFEHPKPLALVPKQHFLMCSSATARPTLLFGGVRCYRRSLHADGIETQ